MAKLPSGAAAESAGVPAVLGARLFVAGLLFVG